MSMRIAIKRELPIRYYSDRFPVQRLVRVGMKGGGLLRIYRYKRKNDGFYRPKLRRRFLPMGMGERASTPARAPSAAKD